jgi:hypothetical protein
VQYGYLRTALGLARGELLPATSRRRSAKSMMTQQLQNSRPEIDYPGPSPVDEFEPAIPRPYGPIAADQGSPQHV